MISCRFCYYLDKKTCRTWALLSKNKHGLHDDWLLHFNNVIMERKVLKGPITLIKGLERFLYKDTLKSLGPTIWKE